MYESIALYDRVAAVMAPEDVDDLRVLVDFADDHGISAREILVPVVGEYEAGWILEALLRKENGVVAQQVLAGLTDQLRDDIQDAYSECVDREPVARWTAALEAADVAGLPCEAWAVVADVAMEWRLSAAGYVRLCRTAPDGVVRAATAARVFSATGDVAEAWDAATGPLTREVR